MFADSTTKPLVIKILPLLLCVFCAQISGAQTVRTMTMTLDEDSPVFMLKEIGGIVTETNDTIKVQMVMPPDNRLKDYKEVDIQAGDIIKMANGKKIESVKALEELYNSLTVGEELKLGLIRGKEMKIAAMVKGDESKMPGKMMVMTAGGPGGDISTGLMDAGLLLKASEGHLVVEDVIEQIQIPFEGPAPERGDVILQFNNQAIGSSEKLDEVYGAIEIGQKIELKIQRDGKELTTTFVKPEARPLQKAVIKKGE